MSPDGSTKPLPEEKLLNLIRGKPSPAEAGKPGAGPSPSKPPAAPGSATGDEGRVSADVARPAQPMHWPRLVAVICAAVLTMEAAWLIVQAVRPIPSLRVPPIPPHFATTAESPPPVPEMPSLAQSARPGLFSSPLDAGSGTTGTPVIPGVSPSQAAKALAARLSLMGLVSGNPAQAIIEDGQTKKTYFVTVGQAVVDGAVLDRVLDNRVVLTLDGEQFELNL